MSAIPPSIPKNGSSKRKAIIIRSVVAGFFGGGVVGYLLARAWAEWATKDPEWDGGMAVLVVYAIIAIVTLAAGVLGAALSGLVSYLIQRKRV